MQASRVSCLTKAGFHDFDKRMQLISGFLYNDFPEIFCQVVNLPLMLLRNQLWTKAAERKTLASPRH